jgi:hypothetical protein
MNDDLSPKTQTLLKLLRDIVQIDPGRRGLNGNPYWNLFTATADDFVRACQSIADHPNPRLAIVTGFFIPTAHPPAHETDGPLGALFLLRACESMGISSVIVTDPEGGDAVHAGLHRCAIPFDRYRELPRLYGENWYTTPSHLLGFSPTHYVFIERAGPNANGRCLTMRGMDITERMWPVHRWIQKTADDITQGQSVVTIGIGDGGNEIGMGKIDPKLVASSIPTGAEIHCCVATDYLIVAGVSNWGSYALAAGLFLLRGQRPPVMLFDPQQEYHLLEILVREGGLVDGVTGQRSVSVDGLAWGEYIQPLVRIREVMRW